jgi:hypothetical protein
MTEQKSSIRPYALGLTILSGLVRLMPHPPNFAPVGGTSLFAGARLNGWYAYLLPLVVMAVTDPLLGGYSFGTPYIYASFLLSVLIGRSLRTTNNPLRIGAATLACSVQFFLISNFAYFVEYSPHTLSGLVACYAGALPFFPATLMGDAAWTAVLFGLHYALSRTIAPDERALASR